jgi:hypothetical protein
MMLIKNTMSFLFLIVITGSSASQEIINDRAAFEKQYQERILQEVLNGVYIPFDLDDAFGELERLSDRDMIVKFQSANEDTIAKKLHFSLGRWMIRNWGFYEGSRLSHYLKEAGLAFPDDMAKFIIVSWHRKLNQKPIDQESQILAIQEFRKQEAIEREKRKKVIKVEKRPGKNR